MPAIDVDDLAKLSTQPWAQNILTSMTITYRREAGLTDTGPRPVSSPHSTWWRDLGDRLAAATDTTDANPANDGLVTEIQAAWICGSSPGGIRTAIDTGRLRGVQLQTDGTYRIPITSLDAAGMLQRGYEPAPSQPAVDLPSTTTGEPRDEDA